MRLLIAAVGRLKDGGERVLVDRYLKRLTSAKALGLGPVTEKELVEARHTTVPERQADEAARLLKFADSADLIIALDERGKPLSSQAFAAWLGARRDAGRRHAAFLIGGADGHGPQIREKADLLLSLSPMTLPHGLARAVLIEQLYRATTILAGHPYHRA